MTEDLASQLIDAQTGYYQGWARSDRVDLYQSGIGSPLLAGIVDGYGVPASWKQALGASKSETFFRALRHVSDAWRAFYIKHHDDAYAELDWARPLEDPRLSPRLFHEFSDNPADEGGASFLGLYVEDVEDLVLLMYAPGDVFRISLFGSMKTVVPEALTAVSQGW